MRAIFQEKRKKEQKKFWKKEKYLKSLVTMYKIWNILKKGRWLCAIIARNKLLKKALEL